MAVSATAAAQGPPRPVPAGADAGTAAPASAALPLDSLLPAALRVVVLRANPELVARRIAVDAARARVRAAGFAPAAELSVSTEEAPNANPFAGNVTALVTREFLSGGRRAALRGVSGADVRAAEAALAVAERQVLARALRAGTRAVGWSAITQRLAAQDSLLASAEVSLRARFAVADARYVDVLRLRTERLRVQADQAAAVTEARTGVIELETLVAGDSGAAGALRAAVTALTTGAPASGGAAAVGPLARGVLPPAPPVEVLLAQSGQLPLAEAEVTRALAAQRFVLAGQRPVFTAGIGFGRVVPDQPGEGTGVVYSPAVQASVSLPFTARRAYAAAASAAGQGVAAATAARQATVATLTGALRAARERYEAARIRLAVFDAALLRGAREERESALGAYRAGDLSLIELVDFERALSRVEIDRTRAVLDGLTALAELYTGAPASEGALPTSSATGAAQGTNAP